MAKRVIKVTINQDGTIKINNVGNPDEKRILAELEELAKVLTGESKGFEIEKHVHTHLTAHTHTHADGTVHSH
jgi:hypothetical protein